MSGVWNRSPFFSLGTLKTINRVKCIFFCYFFLLSLFFPSLDLERKEGPNRAIQSYALCVLVSVPPKKKKKKKNALSFQAESESERRLSDLDIYTRARISRERERSK